MIEKPKRPKQLSNQERKIPANIQELITRYDLDNTEIYDYLDKLVKEIIPKNSLLDLTNPVGSIYMSLNSTNPSQLFGGTWEQLKDRFLIGCGDYNNNGALGGNDSVTLSQDNLPARTMVSTYFNGGNISYAQWNAGNIGSQWIASDLHDLGYEREKPFSIMPPYLAVYMWKRIA